MYKIVEKKYLNPTVVQMKIEAPDVVHRAKAGQFVILRVTDDGERIPLTIAGVDKQKSLVKIIFQIVGATTFILSQKKEGESITDFVGPLGKATEIEGLKKVCVVGGGVGSAIALPLAEALKAQGTNVTSIVGFRNKDLVILEDEFKAASDNFILMTDDGSYKRQGNVTVPLKELLEEVKKTGDKFDEVIAIGPLVMMKFTVLTAKEFGVPCVVSMNPIMIDGTGMCGCCRLTLNTPEGKKVHFACVDGPDFNGYEVDFDEAMSRSRTYGEFEHKKYEEACNLFKATK